MSSNPAGAPAGVGTAAEVAQVLAEQLGRAELAPDRDFFAEGGHSVAATRVAVVLRRWLGRAVPINAVHEFRTAEALAAALPGFPLLQERPVTAFGPQAEELSPAQRAMLAAMRLAPEVGVYNIGVAAELSGPLSTGRLRAAISSAVTTQSGAFARLAADDSVRRGAGGIDLRETADPSPEWATGLVTEPIDVHDGPTVRVGLAGTGPRTSLFVLVVPHLFFDGLAVRSLLGAIAAAYRGERLPAADPSTPDSADFAAVDDDRAADDEAGWTRFWGQRPRTDPTDVRGGYQPGRWTAQQSSAIRSAAAACGGTVFSVVYAGVAVVADRLGGGEPVSLAFPVSRRGTTTIADGHRIRLDRVTTAVGADDTLRSLVDAVTTGVADVLARPGPDGGDRPPPPVVLAPQGDPFGEFTLPDILVRPRPVHNGTAKFEVALLLFEDDEEIGLDVEHLRQSSTPDHAARLQRLVLDTVARLAADPDVPVRELGLTTGAGSALTGPRVRYDRDSSIHRRYAEVAARHPDHVAVERAGRPVTYRQLGLAADRVAARVREALPDGGSAVAISAARSPELLAAVLGVLAAGHHYVLLDAAQPVARRRGIARASEVRLVLTDRTGADDLGVPALPVADGRTDLSDLEGEPDWSGWAEVDPSAPACVFFSSGSTGSPKAILSPHRATLRTFDGQEFGGFGPDTRMLHVAALPWDGFTLETWGPLLNGGTCVLHPDEDLDLDRLANSLRTGAVNTLWLSAALFNALVDHAPDALAGVRRLMIGGEALSPEHVSRHLRAGGRGSLINGYGPAESTVFVTTHPITAPPTGPVPVGTVVANTEVLLLDRYGHPVPPHWPGELCVAGDGLALGYRSDPAGTADRFRPHPRGSAGERIYHTGDLAAVDDDGTIHLLGRLDRQVKVSGYRVDPTEVEAAIRAVTGGRAAVITPPTPTGALEIVAFTTPGTSAADGTDGERVRAELAGALPAFLIPSRVIPLPELPLTRNGKLDTAALLELADTPTRNGAGPLTNAAPDAVDPAVLARTVVAAVITEQLGREPAPGQSFLMAGGTSLSAARAAAELTRLTTVALSPRDLLSNGTVESLRDLLLSRSDGVPDFERRLRVAAHLVTIPRELRADVGRMADQ
ncbi:amino acid adenylation domain-containing protein [Saccharothrix sp. HUAS TT1]|uniref:amino acid adenylation domain-containing protein n=1 Tax=unclassified Saccharothrix TaxID=2593673 RepID=UPI00345C54E2